MRKLNLTFVFSHIFVFQCCDSFRAAKYFRTSPFCHEPIVNKNETTTLIFFLRINRFLICLLFLTAAFFACNKDNYNPEQIPSVVCDGLVTDTSGTNENAWILIPNAFTPNGDGINDDYFAFRNKVSALDFKIYDANGTLIFSTTDLLKTWSPVGIYKSNQAFYYRVQATTNANHSIGACGKVHVLFCIPRDSLQYLTFASQASPDGHFSLPLHEPATECP